MKENTGSIKEKRQKDKVIILQEYPPQILSINFSNLLFINTRMVGIPISLAHHEKS